MAGPLETGGPSRQGALAPIITGAKPLDTGDRIAVVFAKPGEAVYFCSLHPHMTGKVGVTAN